MRAGASSSRIIEVHRYMYTYMQLLLLICGRWSRRSDPSPSAVGSSLVALNINSESQRPFLSVLAPRIRQESELVNNVVLRLRTEPLVIRTVTLSFSRTRTFNVPDIRSCPESTLGRNAPSYTRHVTMSHDSNSDSTTADDIHGWPNAPRHQELHTRQPDHTLPYTRMSCSA